MRHKSQLEEKGTTAQCGPQTLFQGVTNSTLVPSLHTSSTYTSHLFKN